MVTNPHHINLNWERMTIYVCKGKRENGSVCNEWHVDTDQFDSHTDRCNECCVGQCDRCRALWPEDEE